MHFHWLRVFLCALFCVSVCFFWFCVLLCVCERVCVRACVLCVWNFSRCFFPAPQAAVKFCGTASRWQPLHSGLSTSQTFGEPATRSAPCSSLNPPGMLCASPPYKADPRTFGFLQFPKVIMENIPPGVPTPKVIEVINEKSSRLGIPTK